MEDPIIILSTASSKQEAQRIARALVGENLAACVQIVPGVESVYVWRGKPCDEPEWLLIVKSRALLFEKAAARIRSLHSYDVPEIVSVAIAQGSDDYLRWMEASLNPQKDRQ
jgi:periplasmic divalent cation tolerance protein